MEFKNYKLLVFSLGIVIVFIGFISCSSSTAPYKPFVGDKAIQYPQKPDTIIALSGNQRVILKIPKPGDPNVVSAGIFWDNGRDSLKHEFPVDKDTLMAIIKNIQSQGQHTFNIYTYYKNFSAKSVVTTVTVNVYGNVYAASLKNRKLISIIQVDGKDTLKWGDPPVGALNTIVRYTNPNGDIDSLFVPPSETSTGINFYKSDSTLSYYTSFLPQGSIDTFYTAEKKLNAASIVQIPSPFDVNFALKGAIAGKSSDCSCGRATAAIDGDKSTYWQPLSGDRKDGEIWITIDLGTSKTFNEVITTMNKYGSRIGSYKILYSDDKSIWKTAYTHSSASGLKAVEKADFVPVHGRYVKIDMFPNTTSSEKIYEIEIYHRKP
jgi:hypothetical protein